MAAAAFAPSLHADERRWSVLTPAKALLNAIVASRIERVERELRRHDAAIREMALVHGGFERVPLSKAELLPFNV